MRRVLIIIILMLLLILSSISVSGRLADSPWPTFKGNNQRTGLSPYNTSHVDGTVKWIHRFDEGTSSSPVIGPDGTIYIGVNNGYFYAFNPDGTIKWETKIGTPVTKEFGGNIDYFSIPMTASIDEDGTIYIASLDNYTFALNSSDGQIKWQFPMRFRSDVWTCPTIGEDGTVYVLSCPPKCGLYALNQDGTEKWYYSFQNAVYNSPAIDADGTILLQHSDISFGSKVIALNQDGSEKWTVDIPMEMESTIMIHEDGTYYIGSFSQDETSAGLYSLTSNGINWHYTVGGKEIMSTPSLSPDGETIYFGSFLGKLHAMNRDGTEKWSSNVGGIIDASPTVSADGTIYIGVQPESVVAKFDPAENPYIGTFMALNPDGTIKWSWIGDRASLGSSAAIGEDGTVYVGTMRGEFVAFGGPEEEIPEEEFKDNTGDTINKEEETPGFEIITILFAIILLFYFKKKSC